MVFGWLLRLILLLVIFLTPLIGDIGGFGYEQAKTLFFIFAVILAGVIWLFINKKTQQKWDSVEIAALIFILVIGITSILGLNLKNSILGVYPYYQGFILYLMLFFFAYLISRSGVTVSQVSWVLFFSAFLVALISIKDLILMTVFHQAVPNYAGRIVSTFGQPNFYAGFLLLCLPLIIRLGRLRILGGLVIIIGIIISCSRIAISLSAAVIVIWFGFKFFKSFRLFIVYLSVFLFLGFWLILKSNFIYQELLEPSTLINQQFISDPEKSVEKRYYFWPLVWQIISEKPLLGYGLENISIAYKNYFVFNKHIFFEIQNQSSIFFKLRSLNLDRSHNYILDILLFSGIFGLLSWGLLICLMIKKSPLILFFPLLIYLIWIQFQNQSVIQLIFFWLLVGLIMKKNIDKSQ